MLEITEKLTRQVAELARLKLTDAEVREFTVQIGKIIHYVDELQRVDVTGIAPLVHPIELATPMREDVVVPPVLDSEKRPTTLGPAPEVIDGGFRVPQIL